MTRDINYLLKTYGTDKKTRYENWSNESNLKEYHKIKTNERLELTETIGKEFYLNKNDIMEVQTIIKTLPRIDILHQRLKEETIIAILCFDIKRYRTNKGRSISDYSASQKYHLTTELVYTVISNLMHYYKQKKTSIFRETTRYDNDILSRGGGTSLYDFEDYN